MILSILSTALLCLTSVEAQNQDDSTSHYDFVIVGGGTSGLVVANRLSELRDVTVAVIEAGDSVLHNLNVSSVTGYGRAFGTEIDWAYQTEDQTHAGGGKQTMRAGKAIGGTSTINGNLRVLVLRKISANECTC
jgi:choline dehydrogenase-like flavoprotein